MSAADDDRALRALEDVAALRRALQELSEADEVLRARAASMRIDPMHLVDSAGLPLLLPVIVARVQGLAALVIRGAADS